MGRERERELDKRERDNVSLDLAVCVLGEISPLWQKLFSNYLLFGKALNLHWQIYYAFGQIYNVINCLKLKNSLDIWSQCLVSLSVVLVWPNFALVKQRGQVGRAKEKNWNWIREIELSRHDALKIIYSVN